MRNQQKAKPAAVVAQGLPVAVTTSQLLVADALFSDLPFSRLAFLTIFLFFSLIPLTESIPPSFLFAFPFLSRFLPVIYIFLFSSSCHVYWAFSWGTKVCIYWGLEGRKTYGKRGGIDFCFFSNIYIVSFFLFLPLACHMSVLPQFSVDCVHC
jgi:hypothetical protein